MKRTVMKKYKTLSIIIVIFLLIAIVFVWQSTLRNTVKQFLLTYYTVSDGTENNLFEDLDGRLNALNFTGEAVSEAELDEIVTTIMHEVFDPVYESYFTKDSYIPSLLMRIDMYASLDDIEIICNQVKIGLNKDEPYRSYRYYYTVNVSLIKDDQIYETKDVKGYFNVKWKSYRWKITQIELRGVEDI